VPLRRCVRIDARAVLGFLKDRTRVLVTHSVALTISRADHILVMAQGHIVAAGPPSSDMPQIRHLARQAVAGSTSSASSSHIASRVASTLDLTQIPSQPTAQPASQLTSQPKPAKPPSSAVGTERRGARGGTAAITKDEERAKGAAKLSTYTFYLQAAGGLPASAAFAAVLAVYSSMNPMQSVALEHWMTTMEGDDATGPRALAACGIYTAVACGMIVVTGCRNLILPYMSVRASRKLHGGMARAVMRAPVAWFEATPLGRILNRFSADIARRRARQPAQPTHSLPRMARG
jgi:hypothetical protein